MFHVLFLSKLQQHLKLLFHKLTHVTIQTFLHTLLTCILSQNYDYFVISNLALINPLYRKIRFEDEKIKVLAFRNILMSAEAVYKIKDRQTKQKGVQK